jgi:hypothetical protein
MWIIQGYSVSNPLPLRRKVRDIFRENMSRGIAKEANTYCNEPYTVGLHLSLQVSIALNPSL